MKLLIAVLVLCSLNFLASAQDCPTFKVVCYYGSWAAYRPGSGFFNVSAIDPNLCTHLIYSFIGLDLDLHPASLDQQMDVNMGALKAFVALKEKNPCLKTSVAIGGWNEGSTKYSAMASDAKMRSEFVDGVLKFISYYGFDGIDVDWEYPTQRGGLSQDRDNFVTLIKELKAKLAPWNYEVTIASSAASDLVDTAYDVANLNPILDGVHLMAYDFISAASTVTGLNAPMTSIEASIKVWLDKGLDKSKLILGVPAYARYYYLQDGNKHDVGAAVTGPGSPSAYTQEKGVLTYYELTYLLEEQMDDNNLNEVESDGTVYAYFDKTWLTYDNAKTFQAKTQYAKEQGYGGVMLWSIDTDDYLNDFVILKAINQALNN